MRTCDFESLLADAAMTGRYFEICNALQKTLRERDELLAALKGLVDYTDAPVAPPALWSAAREAIRKAQP